MAEWRKEPYSINTQPIWVLEAGRRAWRIHKTDHCVGGQWMVMTDAPAFVSTGTVTGRMASRGPNMQNVPVKKGQASSATYIPAPPRRIPTSPYELQALLPSAEPNKKWHRVCEFTAFNEAVGYVESQLHELEALALAAAEEHPAPRRTA